jgi:hypothetical protein
MALDTRVLVLTLCGLACPCWLGACTGSNEPAIGSGSAGARSGGGSGSTTAGATGTSSGSTTGNGAGGTGPGSTTAGVSGTQSSAAGGGASTSSGGRGAGAGGGMSTTSAGRSAGAGTGGAAGAAGRQNDAGSTAGGMYSPLCSDVPPTAAGAPTKGGACTAADAQLCYKTCGPQSVGFKSETCMTGAYVEQSGCSFPTGMDYGCYKIPTTIDASCPMMPPQASQPCSVAACVVCNAGGNYLDSSGASKAGFCVCPAAGASGSSKWTCASSTAWPCPAGQGC